MSDWKFDVDEVGDDDPDADDPDADDPDLEETEAEDDPDLPDALRSRPPLEAGDPDLENVAFVLLGAIAMVLVFVRLWLLVG